MARKYLTNVDLGWIELLKLKLQNLATAPSSPEPGWMYFDTVLDAVMVRNAANDDWLNLTGGSLDTEAVQDLVGAMVSSNTETDITVTYQDGDGTLDFAVPGIETLRRTQGTTLGDSSFDGSLVFLDYDTVWGIDGDGDPYYDADGAAPGEEAVLMVNPDGTLAVVKPGTSLTSDWNTSPGEVQDNLDTHAADTTSVHGIADTSALETTTGAQAKVDAAIAALINSAPGALDTLDELAAAFGDDPNFAATMTTALAGKQPIDADLTAIAGLDSSTAGAIASDGAGWIKKTYAQFKTALSLVKGDVGLGNVDNTSDASKPISTATQTALDAKTGKYTTSTHASSTSITITHNLGTKACVASVAQVSDDVEVYPDISFPTTNTMVCGFASAPTANTLRFTVIG